MIYWYDLVIFSVNEEYRCFNFLDTFDVGESVSWIDRILDSYSIDTGEGRQEDGG